MAGKVGETAELEIPERAWEEAELVWNEAELEIPEKAWEEAEQG